MLQRARAGLFRPQPLRTIIETATVAYVGPNQLTVAREARYDYIEGTRVVVPGTALEASVLFSTYSSPNTTVILSDPICYSGMNALGRRPLVTGANLIATVGCTVTCEAEGLNPSYTIDADTTTAHQSGHTNVVGNGNYLVLTFSSPVTLRYLDILMQSGLGVTDISVQYNNSGYSTVATKKVRNELCYNRIIFPATGPYTTWRIFPTAPASGSDYWRVYDIKAGY